MLLKFQAFEQSVKILLTEEPDEVWCNARSLTLGLLPAVPKVSGAQDAWPSRTITFVVPYAAGGYTDLVGRLAARYVERALGKSVVIDNRTGAGGIVGTQAVANAAPDGYTFCVCSIGAISIAPFTQKVGYDPIQDLAPVGIVSSIGRTVAGGASHSLLR